MNDMENEARNDIGELYSSLCEYILGDADVMAIAGRIERFDRDNTGTIVNEEATMMPAMMPYVRMLLPSISLTEIVGCKVEHTLTIPLIVHGMSNFVMRDLRLISIIKRLLDRIALDTTILSCEVKTLTYTESTIPYLNAGGINRFTYTFSISVTKTGD